MPDEPLLEIIDDLVPAELFGEASKLTAAKGWYYGHGSHEGDWGRFWKMDLEGMAVFDAIWNHVRERCEKLSGCTLRVQRQYANGHTYGLGGQVHVDDHRAGAFTLLYYPMQEWQDGWEGETVFYDEHGEVALSVRPRPNRAVFFDSRIPHAGRAPGRSCSALRVTVAYKLEEVSGREEPVEELPGAQRQYTVRIEAERLRSLIEEQLQLLGQTIRLPGFRPGKIPMTVLEERYGSSARAKVLEKLCADAAANVPKGTLVVSIDISPVEQDVALSLTVIELHKLADPDLAGLTLERLTATASELESFGLTADALSVHLKGQMIDHLERSYSFPLPAGLVDQEFSVIWREAQSRAEPSEADAAEFRHIAERRVRTGIVVAELARRHEIVGASIEDRLLDMLISQARVGERPALAEELRELA